MLFAQRKRDFGRSIDAEKQKQAMLRNKYISVEVVGVFVQALKQGLILGDTCVAGALDIVLTCVHNVDIKTVLFAHLHAGYGDKQDEE